MQCLRNVVGWADATTRTFSYGGTLAARGKRKSGDPETLFSTVKTTGEMPVPQFFRGLLARVHIRPG